jgi:hypothetical protein
LVSFFAWGSLGLPSFYLCFPHSWDGRNVSEAQISFLPSFPLSFLSSFFSPELRAYTSNHAITPFL